MKSGLFQAAITLAAGILASCDQVKLGDKVTDSSLGAIKACEEVVTSRLRAPTTYKRITAGFVFDDSLSFREYKRTVGVGCTDSDEAHYGQCMGSKMMLAYIGGKPFADRGIKHFTQRQRDAETDKTLRKWYKAYKSGPPATRRSGTATIQYDAANAYNAPIRSTATCQFGPIRTAEQFSTHGIYAVIDEQ